MNKINNINKFNKLREQYNMFIYKDFDIVEEENMYIITYYYSLNNDVEFAHKVFFKKNDSKYTIELLNSDNIKYMLFHIGIAEAISYYKLICSKVFKIECGYLDEYQTNWWKKLIYNGLGELRYLNGIEQIPRDVFVDIITNEDKKYITNYLNEKLEFNGNLIPIGGGKDSIVTIELLKKYDNVPFMFYHKRQASYDTCKVAGFDEKCIYEVDREFDKKLFELNEKGYINGHVPISSMIAFVSYLSAYLLNKQYIVLSNEASSNEGNIEGTNINHQYSKSFEFEKDFNEYTNKYFNNKIQYFSLLRGISEYQIAKQLTKYPKYLNIFRSCNVGIKNNKWCLNCSKCLFVYILLLPFIEINKLNEIFGDNILNKKNLELDFRKLIGLEYEKPFECVGTKEEIIFALKKYLNGNNEKNLPYLLQKYYKYIQEYNIDVDYDQYFNDENLIPNEYLKILNKEIN